MSPLAQKILDEIRGQPMQFTDIADAHRDATWPDFLRAWGELRRAEILGREEDGAYRIGPPESA